MDYYESSYVCQKLNSLHQAIYLNDYLNNLPQGVIILFSAKGNLNSLDLLNYPNWISSAFTEIDIKNEFYGIIDFDTKNVKIMDTLNDGTLYLGHKYSVLANKSTDSERVKFQYIIDDYLYTPIRDESKFNFIVYSPNAVAVLDYISANSQGRIQFISTQTPLNIEKIKKTHSMINFYSLASNYNLF